MNPQSESDLQAFRHELLAWWALPGNSRPYPWRESDNRTPYRALIAEIMLRRTRADQVASTYRSFLLRYPTLRDALAAPEVDIRSALYPLGLVWRIDNVIELFRALRVSASEASDIPADYTELLQLPGVGDYVASAIMCFAGGDSTATLIDVNVTRVLGRIFGLPVHPEARRQKPMRDLAVRAVDRARTDAYHYAILDFAALVCVAGKPRCSDCPMGRARCCNYYLNVYDQNAATVVGNTYQTVQGEEEE